MVTWFNFSFFNLKRKQVLEREMPTVQTFCDNLHEALFFEALRLFMYIFVWRVNILNNFAFDQLDNNRFYNYKESIEISRISFFDKIQIPFSWVLLASSLASLARPSPLSLGKKKSTQMIAMNLTSSLNSSSLRRILKARTSLAWSGSKGFGSVWGSPTIPS